MRDYDSEEAWIDSVVDRDADRREDARREDYDDAHTPNMECGECGYEWYSVITRGRDDPPEALTPDCPRCNP